MLPITSLYFRSEKCQNMITNNDIVTAVANTYNDVTEGKKLHNNRGYRNYMMWKFGHLGKNNWVVIPRCVAWLIRKKWPLADGLYTDFKKP